MPPGADLLETGETNVTHVTLGTDGDRCSPAGGLPEAHSSRNTSASPAQSSGTPRWPGVSLVLGPVIEARNGDQHPNGWPLGERAGAPSTAAAEGVTAAKPVQVRYKSPSRTRINTGYSDGRLDRQSSVPPAPRERLVRREGRRARLTLVLQSGQALLTLYDMAALAGCSYWTV